jgi:hypothetical protein
MAFLIQKRMLACRTLYKEELSDLYRRTDVNTRHASIKPCVDMKVKFLDNFHRPVFYFKHASETGFHLSLQEVPIQLDPIKRSS